MDRYQMMRLAQLVFALGLMFAAFLVGIGSGWAIWGRRRRQDRAESARYVAPPEPAVPRIVNRDLFSPESDLEQVVDVTVATFAPAELGAGAGPGAKVSP